MYSGVPRGGEFAQYFCPGVWELRWLSHSHWVNVPAIIIIIVIIIIVIIIIIIINVYIHVPVSMDSPYVSEMSNLASNPFAALFPSVEKAEEYSREQRRKSQKVGESHVSSQGSSVTISLKNEDAVPQIIEGHQRGDEETARVVNDLLQRVFLITVDDGK